MPKFTVVYAIQQEDGQMSLLHEVLADKVAAAAWLSGKGDDGGVMIFQGEPIPFTIKAEPTVTIGEPKAARKRAKKAAVDAAPADPAAPYGRKKDGTPKSRPGRKVVEGNGAPEPPTA